MKKLTEKQAVNCLKELSKKWPDTLWLYSASGSLHVMKNGPDGNRVMVEQESPGPGYDFGESLAVIDIENDGGDW